MTDASISDLKNTELEFAFAKAMGYSLVGENGGPFVLWDKLSSSHLIFGGDESSISYASFMKDFAYIPLQIGQELGAVLSTRNSTAMCQIGDVVASGDDYLEALIRAIVLHKRAHQS